MSHWRFGTTLAVLALVCAADEVGAQGLIWNLPTDGSEVIYEGKLTQTQIRPDGEQITTEWDQQLLLRSVGSQNATVNDNEVPARWIELEIKTGKLSEQGIDTGPIGTRVYRVLVEESKITGKPTDDRGIPNAFLPIVEGYVRIGEQPVQKLESGLLQTFPSIAHLAYYAADKLANVGEEDVTVPAGDFPSKKFTATEEEENPSTRTENTATFFVSDSIPFGLVSWEATTINSIKDPNQPRDAFVKSEEIKSVMEARAINEAARAVLQVP